MLEIGSLVDGKYKILNKVGQGGMSVVYLAMNEKANKQWAVKEVRKDGIKDFEVVQQGLVAETNILKKLNHPHLPSIIDVIDTDDTFIIIMDYVQGNCLKDVLGEYGAQPQEYVVEWAKQLCNVLIYLHSRKPAIIYRDMKPANIMWTPDEIVGGQRTPAGKVTLIDFGTAREYKGRDVADTWCLGTEGYAAPEQHGHGKVTDARTDIFNLGATLYHLVTGKNPSEPPYEIKPIREITPSLSSGLEQIILKCTQRDPNDRYQSAAELMYALEHYNEIDDIYRKKQKRKLGAFITTLSLTIALAITSVWGYLSAESKKSENYDNILASASTVDDYYKAILTDPTRIDAYLQLNEHLTSDYAISKEEGQQLMKLLAGLDETASNGFSQSVPVLNELLVSNLAGHRDVCFDIGWSFLSYYDTSIDRDRYSNAAKWFEFVRDNGTENGEIAGIFCDISACTTKINQLHGSKVIQTQELRAQREGLWQMVQDLKNKAAGYSEDYMLQTWIEIDGLIDSNLSDFLEVAQPQELITMLTEIRDGVGSIQNANPDIQKLIEQLKQSTTSTIQRVETAQG